MPLTPVLSAHWDEPDCFMIDGYRRIIRAHGAVLHESVINACQQHGRAGKQLLTIPLRERCRRSANRDDEIRLTPR